MLSLSVESQRVTLATSSPRQEAVKASSAGGRQGAENAEHISPGASQVESRIVALCNGTSLAILRLWKQLQCWIITIKVEQKVRR